MRRQLACLLFVGLSVSFVNNVCGQNRNFYRDSLQKQLLIQTNDTTRCRIFHLLSQNFMDENTDSALFWADKAWKAVNDLKWEKGIAVVNSDYSTIYTSLGDQKKAIAYLEKSVKYDLKPGNEHNLTADYINMAAAWQQLNNYPKSLDYLYKALKIATQIKDDNLLGIVFGNFSDLYDIQKDYKKSRNYIQQQINVAKKSGDDEVLGTAYLRMGQSYVQNEQEDSAKVYLQMGLQLAKAVENKLLEARILSMLAVCYENEDPQKIPILLAAQKIYDLGFTKNVSSINNLGNLGGTYASMGLHDTLQAYTAAEKITYLKLAEQYLEKAIAYARETGDLEGLIEFADYMAQVQEGRGDYESALINFKLSKHLDDSLHSQENKNAMANKEAQYLEELMQQKNEVHKLELQKFWLMGAIALALLIFITALLINYFRLQKIRALHSLRQKEAEEVAKELLHQNNITESELKAIRSQMNPHFIFNVLNSLESYIMDNDKQSACKLVQKFAGLSRLILENSTHSFVQASKEWKALMLYTELQALRYNHNFTYHFSADADLDLTSFYLPPMLIQPLIENAILHAMLPSQKDRPSLHVLLEKKVDQIKITIIDNGPGITTLKKVKPIHELKEKSLGIKFIEERIAMLNQNYDKPQASFSLLNSENSKGAVAILILPVWTGIEMKEAM